MIPEVGVPLVERGLAPGEEEQEEDGGAQQDARVVDLPHHWPSGTPKSIASRLRRFCDEKIKG